VDFSRGACNFCGACAKICPRQALQFDPAVPPWYLSAIITADCLQNNKVLCGTCTEHCDKGAISFWEKNMPQNKALRVQSEKCNGCGACYHSCPINAITFKSLKFT
jgi:ferredoxin-type protein NapF